MFTRTVIACCCFREHGGHMNWSSGTARSSIHPTTSPGGRTHNAHLHSLHTTSESEPLLHPSQIPLWGKTIFENVHELRVSNVSVPCSPMLVAEMYFGPISKQREHDQAVCGTYPEYPMLENVVT